MSDRVLGLFEGVGIEIEYMIVDADTLSVRPIADEVLRQIGGGYDLEVELGAVAWSNELALHVIEMKTNGPAVDLAGLGELFQEHARRIEELLRPMNARLMPTAMHPWMNPDLELRLWPHENNAIYATFDRIFDCRGHGWANLQSVHLNLPFRGDDEFGRLHAAIRFLLPILPALAASSPILEGAPAATLDTRMAMYAGNARRVPSVSGIVIPERVYTRRDYETQLLGKIYDDLAPLDPQGVLRHEWVNARGCIARFDRDAIEIRVLDVQEYPGADIGVAAAIVALLRRLVEQPACAAWEETRLAAILGVTVAAAERAILDDAEYLKLLGFPGRAPVSAHEVWQYVIEELAAGEPGADAARPFYSAYTQHGCLARRILDETGNSPAPQRLHETYRRICDCLRDGRPFLPDAP